MGKLQLCSKGLTINLILFIRDPSKQFWVLVQNIALEFLEPYNNY
jgi:hypothetical protein